MMALETRNRQLKQRVAELERENSRLSESLRNAETIEKQTEEGEESWPELIDDDSLR